MFISPSSIKYSAESLSVGYRKPDTGSHIQKMQHRKSDTGSATQEVNIDTRVHHAAGNSVTVKLSLSHNRDFPVGFTTTPPTPPPPPPSSSPQNITRNLAQITKTINYYIIVYIL